MIYFYCKFYEHYNVLRFSEDEEEEKTNDRNKIIKKKQLGM